MEERRSEERLEGRLFCRIDTFMSYRHFEMIARMPARTYVCVCVLSVSCAVSVRAVLYAYVRAVCVCACCIHTAQHAHSLTHRARHTQHAHTQTPNVQTRSTHTRTPKGACSRTPPLLSSARSRRWGQWCTLLYGAHSFARHLTKKNPK